MTFVVLTGVARGDPNAALLAVEDALSAAAATILDVGFFSGIHVMIRLEFPAAMAPVLRAGLLGCGVRLDAASLGALDALDRSEGDVAGSLAITWVDGDPTLRREIPAVPG